MKKRVFISYAHQDERFVDELKEILSELGVECYLHMLEFEPGSSLTREVINNIKESAAFLVVLSPASIKSQWVCFEVGVAKGEGMTVLPLLFHPSIDVPDFLGGTSHLVGLKDAEEFFSSTRWTLAVSRRKEIEEAKMAPSKSFEEGENGETSAFVFLKVPALGSKGLVKRLHGLPWVKEAAAVYTEYDVVAYLSGPAAEVGDTMLDIASLPSITEQKILVFRPKGKGSQSHEGRPFPSTRSICAYVLVTIHTLDQGEVVENIRELDQCDYAYPLENKSLLIARVTADDIAVFDALIMERIQSVEGVASTRSYVVINLEGYHYP